MRLNRLARAFSRQHVVPDIIICLAIFFTAMDVHAGQMDGIIMRHGVVMLMKNGKAMMPMSQQTTLADGSVVQLNGNVQRRGGTLVHLRDGDMIMMDGHIMYGRKAAAMQKQEAP
jgi:hypothetical protein